MLSILASAPFQFNPRNFFASYDIEKVNETDSGIVDRIISFVIDPFLGFISNYLNTNDPKAESLFQKNKIVEQHSLATLLTYIYRAYYYKIGKYCFGPNCAQDRSIILKKEEKITQIALLTLIDFDNCIEEMDKKMFEISFPRENEGLYWHADQTPSQLKEEAGICEGTCHCMDYLLKTAPHLTENIQKIKNIAEKYKPFINVDQKINLTIHKMNFYKIFSFLEILKKYQNFQLIVDAFYKNPNFDEEFIEKIKALVEYEQANGKIEVPIQNS